MNLDRTWAGPPARLLRSVLLVLLLGYAAPAAAQDTAADSAWMRGDIPASERLYAARLAADSTDALALHRLALIRAWDQRYIESLQLFDRLLALAPQDLEARVNRARVFGWQGDTRRALQEVDAVLARDPDFLPALQARAQFLSWSGDLDDALSSYERVLEVAPEDRAARFDRARALSRASRFREALAAYDSLVRANPGDRDALMGLAQVLAWSARLDSAEAVYRRVLAQSPDDAEALQGLARVASWGGRLVEGERRWRVALRAHPEDVTARVGLAQTLRWQGRNAAALEVLNEALSAAPQDRDAREQLAWVRQALSPRAAPGVVYESDSDGNRITTTSLTGAVRLRPRVELRGDLYLRRTALEQALPATDLQAWGAAVTLGRQFEPGWGASATVGASGSSHDDSEVVPTLRASLASPGRYPVGGVLSYALEALDATALMVRQRVVTQQVALTASAARAGWSLAGGAAVADYHGRASDQHNQRVGGQLTAMRRVAGTASLGAGVRAFGFREDLNDGYFDPDFFGLAEAIIRWTPESRRWSLNVEAAPGVQQVRSDGDPSASLRASGRLAYLVAPGRSVGITLGFANSGLQQLSPAESSEYRYLALGVSGAWSF